MNRQALIIYCDDTQNSPLLGPSRDYENYYNFLTSYAGGEWSHFEIKGLQNPTKKEVENTIASFKDVDYSFIVFSGHGFFNMLPTDKNQYMVLKDGYLRIDSLRTKADRQTIIMDACRNLTNYTQTLGNIPKQEDSPFFGDPMLSTRDLFDKAVLNAEKGLVVLYSSNVGESSFDTVDGGVYSHSLLMKSLEWWQTDMKYNIMPLDTIHHYAKITVSHWAKAQGKNQNPHIVSYVPMAPTKRKVFFPFAVKQTY